MTNIAHRPALLSLLLGAAAACGFAPLDLWPLTIGCLAAWLLLVHRAPTLKAALWRGWCFGVGHFTINNNWIQHAFIYQDEMPHWLGYLAPLALALYLAVYPMLAAGLMWRLRGHRPDAAYALLAGAAWIATEWLRATMFTGYAWDPLGTIWVPVQAVAGASAWVGTYALSGLTVVLAAGVLTLWLRRRRWPVAAALAVLLIAQLLSYRGATDVAALPANHPQLVVVQPNVGQDERGESDGELMLRRLTALSGRAGPGPRLVLWPEGVIRDLPEDGYPLWVYNGVSPYALRQRLAKVLGVRDTLLAGGTALRFDRAGDVVSATNSTFAISPVGRITGRYDKAHLVPYGEYLPMRPLLEPIGLSRLVPGSLDFEPGPGPLAFDVPGFGAVGHQICYEIIFSGEVVGAPRPRLLFNPSNDAWFGAWGPPQHLAQARMRAIEEALPIVRSTPNGISAVIAADGRVLASVPRHVAGAITVPLPPPGAPTLFSRLGNLAAAIVAVALAGAAVALRRRRR